MGSKCLDLSSELVGFMDGLPVKSLHELLNSELHGVCIVAAFFDSVVEGVDLWFSDDQSREHPRFRMKMKVTHGDDVAVFSVFDKEVQKLAIETCPLMLSMGESCSLYPDEMEVFYGEPFVWKVEPRDSHDFEKLPSFKVQSICNNAGVVDKFFEEYVMDPGTFVHHPPDLISDHAHEASLFCNSSCGSNDVACVDADLPVSPSFVGARVNAQEIASHGCGNLTPKSEHSCSKPKRKIKRDRVGLSLETVVFSRRKSCIRRKLSFDDGDDVVIAKKMDSTASNIKKI
ncbi:unnamed protein product [Trifolium pratense]|uniref:Uncharacterized protein n=1 Tax=Trifolium pratense TaxID=57577 RepID=A0ACB0J225_TRIPR|nr:unnamed protein product [Trifolium pratense]